MADRTTRNNTGLPGGASDQPWDETTNDFDVSAAEGFQEMLDDMHVNDAVEKLRSLDSTADTKVLQEVLRKEIKKGDEGLLPDPTSEAPIHVHLERANIKNRPSGRKHKTKRMREEARLEAMKKPREPEDDNDRKPSAREDK